ncbi:UspA domain protein, partial [Methylorubrum extorquens DSM 13060]
MKTLLVPVTLHDALPSVFATAVLVARRFGSLIEGVALRPALAEYVPVDMVGGMTWLRDEEADQAEAQDAGQRFVAAMEAAGLPRREPGA